MISLKYSRLFILSALAAAIFAVFVPGCAAGSSGEENGRQPESVAEADYGYKEGDIMPDFSVELADGGTFTLSEHSGEAVFINLFATWCSPCLAEMPDIQELYEAYGDDVRFLIIGIGETKTAVADFAADYGYTLPMAYSGGGSFGQYSVQFIPQSFILNKDGIIDFYAEGMADYETFGSALDDILAK